MNIQNHFSDTALLSLAELKTRLEQDSKLDARKQREMVSAINTTAKWLNLPAEMIPASATFLRGKFQGVHPAHHNVTKRRVQNIKSLILSAMRSQGLSTKLGSYLAKMSPPWLKLWDIIEGERYYRTEFSRFFRYCSKQGIAPSAISDQVLTDYLQAVEAESFVKTPKVRQQSICRLWNKCAELYQSKGWPQIKLTVPCYETRRYALDDDQFPPVLLRELKAYLTSLSGTDPFNMQVKAFRPRSLKSIEGHFKRYISALHHQGVDLSGLTSLEALATKEMFQLAMRWFWDRNGEQTSKHIGEIAWTIRCYATKHLTADEETRAFYAGAMKRLRVSQDGLSDKNQRAMAQFDDPKMIEALVGLPIKLWAKAERSRNTASTHRRSKELQLCVQAAVAIEILIFAPMRISNLQNLRLDQHISWQNKHAVIHIPRAQVKNDIDLVFKLPLTVSQRIQTYIRDWRALYTEGANPYLFPGRKMNPKDGTRLRRQISKALWDEAGIKLTPHQFRHATAKILLDAKPGFYEAVRKILGHKNLTTTYAHYAGAETQAALDLYDDVILEHRKGTSFGSAQRKGKFQEPPFMDPLQIYGGKKMTVAPRTALPLSDWPEMDKVLWATATQTGDFLEADGKAAHWAAPTKLQVQKGYGKWLYFQNLAPDTASNTPQKPSERISEATLRAYLAWLKKQGLASQTIASRITDLTEALRVMEPEANLELLRTLCTTLQGQAEPSRNKHARIRAPREIWKACEAFMLEIARSENPLTHPIASRYRDAMILGVLSHRPLRRRNIASLALGVHLTQDAGKWRCTIPHTETKDGRSIEFALPQDAGFAACFSYYVQTMRQKLLKHHPIGQDALHTLTGPLWVSTRGRILTDHALYYAVIRISEELLGKPLYPHLLRDCAASAMSSDAPEYILAASRILGHSSLKTTLSHYEQSSMLAAGARLVEHMSALQAKLEAEAPEAFFDEVVFDTLEGDWE